MPDSKRPAVPSFDPFDPGVTEDPYPVYRELRAASPVAYNEELDAWFVLRFSDVIAAAHDPARFSSAEGPALLPPTGGDGAASSPARTIMSMDNPDHDRYRGLVSRMFTPRAVAGFEPQVRRVVADFLDGIDPSAGCELMGSFANPVPVVVVGDLLGVAPEDRGRFREWADLLVHQDARRPETLAAGREAGAAIGRYFFEVIEARRSAPGEDVVSALLAARVDGEPVDVGAIIGFCFLLIVAGTETTTNLVANAVLALAADPGARTALRADPARLPGAIEEVLRYDSPVQGLSRVTTEDVDVGGVRIPSGARVQLRFGSANRDEREHPEPDRFDIGRRAERHVAFGHGLHFCLGAALARLEARVMLGELLARLPDWEVADVQRWPSGEVRGPARLDLTFAG